MKINPFDAAVNEKWAISADALEKILKIADRDNEVDLAAVAAARGSRLDNTTGVSVRDGFATLNLTGPIFRYANLFTDISGATSIEIMARDLRAAADATKIKGIVLAIDSPGGTVNGTNELAKMVRDVAAEKPLVAYVSGAGASGAYWIATAANKIFMDETAMIGSIGVVGTFIDTSKQDAARGIDRVTFVSSQTPHKRPDLHSDEGRAVIQRDVDMLAQLFIDWVAENRGVTVETVMEDFGRGNAVIGAEAVAAGMADGISSYEEVLAAMVRGEFVAGDRRHTAVKSKGKKAMDKTKITAASLAADAPEVAAELKEQGAKEGHAAGLAEGQKIAGEAAKKEGMAAGAKAERDRIAGLKAISIPGFEAMLEAAIADGVSTAADLGVKQSAAIKDRGIKSVEAIQADEKAIAGKVPGAAASETGEAAAGASARSGTDPFAADADIDKVWAANADIRTEFDGKKEDYAAYVKAKAAGRIKEQRRRA
jgi:signal peptide peptidase SppA